MYVTFLNHQPSICVSTFCNNKVWGTDDSTITWKKLMGYAFHPTIIIDHVVRKVHERDWILVLVAHIGSAKYGSLSIKPTSRVPDCVDS